MSAMLVLTCSLVRENAMYYHVHVCTLKPDLVQVRSSRIQMIRLVINHNMNHTTIPYLISYYLNHYYRKINDTKYQRMLYMIFHFIIYILKRWHRREAGGTCRRAAGPPPLQKPPSRLPHTRSSPGAAPGPAWSAICRFVKRLPPD
jgi:hypothetical protein